MEITISVDKRADSSTACYMKLYFSALFNVRVSPHLCDASAKILSLAFWAVLAPCRQLVISALEISSCRPKRSMATYKK